MFYIVHFVCKNCTLRDCLGVSFLVLEKPRKSKVEKKKAKIRYSENKIINNSIELVVLRRQIKEGN